MDKHGVGRGARIIKMAGRRPLTFAEERHLLRVVRKLPPRNRALITTQWFTGFRISEVLSLTISSVWRDGKFLPRVGVQPRHLKGGHGGTRWIPMVPELQRALECHLNWLTRHFDITPQLPLFVSRQHNHGMRPISRVQAHSIVKAAFSAAHVEDDGRLRTHTLRKTFARAVYKNSGKDIMVLKAALHHSDLSVTQKYLDVGEDEVAAVIARCDFTRAPRPRKSAAFVAVGLPPAAVLLAG